MIRTLFVHCDASKNSFYRFYPFAKALEEHVDFEVYAPFLYSNKPFVNLDGDNYHYTNCSNMLKATFSIIKSIKGNYDLVHCFKYFPSSSIPAIIKSLKLKVPLVMDLEDYERGGINSLWDNLYTKLFEQTCRFADELTVSNTTLQTIYGGTLIPPATDTDQFKPSIKEDSTITIGYFGTIAYFKGTNALLSAFEHLSKSYDIELIICGGGNKDIMSRMKKMKNTSHLNYLGFVEYDELPTLYNKCDIVCIPIIDNSFTRGQVPGKLFDALAAGKAIIGSDVGDMGKILGGMGYLLEDSSTQESLEQSLIIGLEQLITNDSLRKDLGRHARELAVKEYSLERMRERLLTLYESLTS